MLWRQSFIRKYVYTLTISVEISENEAVVSSAADIEAIALHLVSNVIKPLRRNTGYEAAQAGACVINLPFNTGYGVALQTGLIWAKRQGAKVVVTLDADGQHDPAEITKILGPVLGGEADLALGSRYLENGSCYR